MPAWSAWHLAHSWPWTHTLADKQLRRSIFTSVDHLTDTIDEWADHWIDDPEPFIWHKTAEEIVAEVRRGRATSPTRSVP